MRNLITLCLLLLTGSNSQAAELHVLEIQDLSVEYWKYEGLYRNSYLAEKSGDPMQLQDGAALNLRLNPINYTYIDNRIHMASDTDRHVRYVGWEWEAGVQYKMIDVFEHHHSQHGLEYINPRGDGFPLENSYGVRIHIIGDCK